MAVANRIRSFTRWPEDRAARIEAAKVEIGAMNFWVTLAQMDGYEDAEACAGSVPEPFMRRANRAFDLLCDEGVPAVEWEK